MCVEQLLISMGNGCGARDVTDQINVIVQVTGEVIAQRSIDDGTACVTNEFPFGHFVFDVWRSEINRKKDQREAEDVDSF